VELRQLETFRAVASQLSFTRAAVSLDYAQSSVTAQIQALEAELGVRLFDRLGRRVALTDAGQRLLGYAERLLSLAEEARTALADGAEPAGTLAVGAPETVLTYRLPSVLRRFRARVPRVRLVFRPTANADLQRAIGDGTLDVGFALGEPLQPRGLAVETLCAEPLAVVAPPEHSLAAAARVEPADLQRETLLLTRPGCGYRALFASTLAAAGIQPAGSLDFGSVEAIKQCVAAGLGIAALPHAAVAAELADRRLVALGWAGPPLEVATQLLWHPARAWSAPLRAFLDIARAGTPAPSTGAARPDAPSGSVDAGVPRLSCPPRPEGIPHETG
jgi:DNA-binding transcriptional LysR family regulator